MNFFQKPKPLKERPEDERRPSLKNSVDRRIALIFSIVAVIALALLIVLIVYIKSLGL